ncbi:autoinducer synthase [Sphingomonas sp. So64.6b]|nr:autoinducer synthase [Sphingomonas sp. So64.6b]
MHLMGYSPRWADDPRLCAMFTARKRVFVDLLRWDVPVIADRFEVDQFDGPGAQYLLLSDPAGAHLASVRLLPTTRPHILDTLFAGLCDGPVPAGPAILEITRFCLDRRLSAAARLSVRNQLVSALVDHALGAGIASYTGVAEIGWLQQILAFGWHCRPLGLPAMSSRTMLGALCIEITPDTPDLLRQAGVWRGAGDDEDVRHAA